MENSGAESSRTSDFFEGLKANWRIYGLAALVLLTIGASSAEIRSNTKDHLKYNEDHDKVVALEVVAQNVPEMRQDIKRILELLAQQNASRR